MSGDWLREQRSEIAAERILDAAAEVFVERGVAATGMADVARAAGCSRATLYRYFENRRALRVAFVHREARRVGDEVDRQLLSSGDPAEMLVDAMLTAVRLVRARPTLAAWFQVGDAGAASEIAHSSEVIEALGLAFLARTGVTGDDTRAVARWIVRIIVSLLTVPGADDSDERAMLEQFVAPVVFSKPRV